MMECRDKNDGIEDDGITMKNQVIWKLGKYERLFEEKRTNIKYKKEKYGLHYPWRGLKEKIRSKSSHKPRF